MAQMHRHCSGGIPYVRLFLLWKQGAKSPLWQCYQIAQETASALFESSNLPKISFICMFYVYIYDFAEEFYSWFLIWVQLKHADP